MILNSKPQFYYIKVGFKGSELYRYVFVMGTVFHLNLKIHLRLWKFISGTFKVSHYLLFIFAVL